MKTIPEAPKILAGLTKFLEPADGITGVHSEAIFDPRGAIDAAAHALTSRSDAEFALARIDRQKLIAERALRSVLLGTEASVKSPETISEAYLRRALCELYLMEVRLMRVANAQYGITDKLVKAVACDGNNPEPKALLAQSYLESGRSREAADLINRAIRDDMTASFDLFQIAANMTGIEPAACEYIFGLSKTRDTVGVIANLCERRIRRLSDPTGSVEAATVESLYASAQRNFHIGNFEGCIDQFCEICAWAPKFSDSWLFLGVSYARSVGWIFRVAQDRIVEPQEQDNRTNQYIRYSAFALQMAMVLGHDTPDVALALAHVELELSHAEKALRLVRQYRDSHPEGIDGFALSALALAMRGEFDAAMAEAGSARSLYPQSRMLDTLDGYLAKISDADD